MTSQAPIDALIDSLTPQQQIAQRLIVGTGGGDEAPLSPTAQHFLTLGVGGLILFRNDVEPFATAAECATWIKGLREQCLGLWVSVDQEGGFIERLPSRWFPSIPSPRAIGEAVRASASSQRGYSTDVAAEAADWLGFYLERLGIGMIMAPTLDVNTEATNPVIGVRSYSDDAETVVNCATVALERFKARNLIAVGKHAPGHGSSTLDSHATLPTLHPTAEELGVFQRLAPQCQALMMAHAHYPNLQAGEALSLPATLSPSVRSLIRNEWGFEGVLITDDLCMGAITQAYSAIESARQAVTAGMDILLYRDAGPDQWTVLEALTDDLTSGRMDATAHRESLRRILTLKQSTQSALPNPTTVAQLFNPASLAAISDSLADRTLTVQTPWPSNESGEAIANKGSWWVIEPDRSNIPQYANEADTATLAQHLMDAGVPVGHSVTYNVTAPWKSPIDCLPENTAILWVSHAPHDAGFRENFVAWLNLFGPSVTIIQVDAGLPLTGVAPGTHLYSGTYRTPNIAALAQRLAPWMAPEKDSVWTGETFDWESILAADPHALDDDATSSD
ncbi:MAG: glycoside hydrolase family 3 N-terminal domain-containing protein [Vampirovibrionales bacterium]|nr:glycoside hydrolase family 3 N-terminal domain-containing protein [Vampirovibrionales bacterium]